MSTEPVVYAPNGINGETGEYLKAPVSATDIVAQAFPSAAAAVNDQQRQKVLNDEQVSGLRDKNQQNKAHLGVKEGVKAEKLAEAGWGVIFRKGEDPAVIKALGPLLNHRKKEAGALYKELEYDPAANPGDPAFGQTKNQFLEFYKAPTAGPVDPVAMPYYLLIVGDPEIIPFEFQYDLDVAYAVGRLHFDTPAEYARYANSVVAVETGKVALPKKAAFFATSNPDDEPTRLSSSLLVAPLAADAKKKEPDWKVEAPAPDACKVAKMAELLCADATPALLVSATHGMGGYIGEARQQEFTGALLCQDWPGQNAPQPVNLRSCIFAGEDVKPEAQVAGMIALMFACYGAGYPKMNTFWDATPGQTRLTQIAARNSVSRLAQRLLAHENGGALAVMGHIDMAWNTSFQDGSLPALSSFQSALGVLMDGKPIGMASEYFNQKYSDLGQQLWQQYRDARKNYPQGCKPLSPVQFANLSTACSDARNYVVIGDPAARLVFGDGNTRKVDMAMIQTDEPVKAQADSPTAPVTGSAAVVMRDSSGKVTQAAASYSISGDVVDALSSALQSIGDALQKAVQTLTELKVTTYTSSQLDKGTDGATLRAQSKISLTGDTESIVPEDAGKVDDAVWKIHSEALDRAIQNRTALLKVIFSALGMGNSGNGAGK